MILRCILKRTREIPIGAKDSPQLTDRKVWKLGESNIKPEDKKMSGAILVSPSTLTEGKTRTEDKYGGIKWRLACEIPFFSF